MTKRWILAWILQLAFLACSDRDAPLPRRRKESMVNDTGELVDVFSCMVWAMGTHGYGYSQALQATRLALDPQPGINDANRGFLRDHIQLAIIIVSDKDDCSASADVALNDGLLLSILFKPGQVPPPGATWTATCRTSAYPPTPDGELAE